MTAADGTARGLVVWHDLECGSYREDLPLWRALAGEFGAPVLDVGAGSGRVALDLATAGIEVVALDADAQLLAALEARARDAGVAARVRTLTADARDFTLDQQVALCLVPMQTIQLLGGADGRLAFLRCARAAVRPGGVVAVAIAVELDEFDIERDGFAPLPDICEHDGVVYSSLPTAVRRDGDGFVLERRRETVTVDGTRTVEPDRIRLDRVGARELEREGRRAGLTVIARRSVPQTRDYVGSEVVMLRV